MQVIHRCGINHSHTNPTNTTVLCRRDPSTKVSGVSNDTLCIGQHVAGFITKELPSTLTLEQRKSKSTFKFGQALREC